MNLLQGNIPACWGPINITVVVGSDGRRRELPRTVAWDAPHVIREDRLWVARIPGRGIRAGIGYTPTDALDDLKRHRTTQDARGSTR